MRRLLFLALFVALVAGMSFGQVTFGGLFDYGIYSDFQKSPEQYPYMKFQFTDQLDQFNTVVFRFRGQDSNFTVPDTFNIIQIDRFYLSSDVTGALGMKDSPVTFKLGFGMQDPNGADLTGGISPFEVADLSGNDIGGAAMATIYPVFTFNKMYNLGAIIAPGAMGLRLAAASQKGQGYEVFLNGPVGPAMAEVGYGNVWKGQTYAYQLQDAALVAIPANVSDAVKGDLTQPALSFVWVAANYKGTQGDIAYALAGNAQFSLDAKDGMNLRNHYAALQDPPASASDFDSVTWGVGLAASVTYQKNYTLKVGLVGLDTSLLNRAELYAVAWLSPQVGIDGGAVLNLDKDYTSSLYGGADLLNDADVGILFQLGKAAQIRVGYLYIDKAAPYSVMADDIGRVGDLNGQGVVSSGMFIESVFSF